MTREADFLDGIGPSRVRRAVKRTLDIVGSVLGLVALAPVFALIAVAVRLGDGGPVFFRQARVGRAGRAFDILKFRTMVPGAEGMGPHLTARGDPRVTRVGRLLRAAKLDELPQLLNVLKGDMSIVGPRPETPDLLARYAPTDRATMVSVRPGITDYASIILRDESALLAREADPTAFYLQALAPLKAALCAHYLRHLGVATDLRIIFATIWVVLSSSPPQLLLDCAALGRVAGAKQIESTMRRDSASPPSPIVASAATTVASRVHAAVLARARSMGPLARKTIGLSALTAAGQLTFVMALPLISRLYSPADFGLFTVYLSIVNICGPVVGLKFESAIYATRTRREASQALGLALVTMAAVSAAALLAIPILAHRLVGPLSQSVQSIGLIVPAGVLLTGLWSASSAWAIKADAIETLAIARFVQPAMMTAVQLAVGLISPSGLSLVVGHLISHFAYSTLVFSRTLTGADLQALSPSRWRSLAGLAQLHRRFPLYVLPAQVSMLMAANLPPILLSLVYGAEIAGYCGLAYRIIAAPLAIVALPLGAVFTSVATRTTNTEVARALAYKVLIVSVVVAAAPMLLFGLTAPLLAGAVLGPRWMLTGNIIAAFSLLGAAQALAAPFSEITSIYRHQGLRFMIEALSATLVALPIGVGALYHWDALTTIWIMSAGGAVGSLNGLRMVWALLGSLAHDEPAARGRVHCLSAEISKA
jgi:lipopolysaccharide/colanic/teichoic acid biosynthesis glycosyltransferase/O-antigen/teichoic acid export membrane protein